MADAIDTASCVVIFVSRAYKESANCRLEANYAHSCARDGLKLIYVMCEEDYTTVSSERITGWLGLLIGQELWYPAWKDPADAAHKVAQKLGVSTSQSQTPGSPARTTGLVKAASEPVGSQAWAVAAGEKVRTPGSPARATDLVKASSEPVRSQSLSVITAGNVNAATGARMETVEEEVEEEEMSSEVRAWLVAEGLGRHKHLFVCHEILQMDDLLQLEEKDVLELFPDVIGARNRLLRSLGKLQGSPSNRRGASGREGGKRGRSGQPSSTCTLA